MLKYGFYKMCLNCYDLMKSKKYVLCHIAIVIYSQAQIVHNFYFIK